VTTPTDIPNLQEAMHCFETASGGRVNIQKSRAIAFGTWDKSIEIMNIPYHDIATILGFQIKNTVGESALASWTKTTVKIRQQAQEAYCRTLTLDKRIEFVHEYLNPIGPLMVFCRRDIEASSFASSRKRTTAIRECPLHSRLELWPKEFCNANVKTCS